jgi:hypothetical protein
MVKLRIEHQPKNSMSRLQIEVAAKMKTVDRNAGDQKSRDALLLAVLCTCKRCGPEPLTSSQPMVGRGRGEDLVVSLARSRASFRLSHKTFV